MTDHHAMGGGVGGDRSQPGSSGQNRLLAAASAIARQIREHAIRLRNGNLVWLAPEDSLAEQHRPTALGPHVYDGTAGIAMFLAALVHLRGGGDDRELSLEAIAPLRHKLAELARNRERADRVKLALGGLSGLGAFIYSFVRIGQWLDEPALIEEARDLQNLVTPQRIAGDEHLDVVLGCAGTILALLALDRVAPEPNEAGVTPLDAASLCARHLLKRQASYGGRPKAWCALENPPLSGFSHGAAGICYALLQLFEKTGQAELLEAAREGLAFERSLYSPGEKNWLDLRYGSLQTQTAWCNGAPGIALGRLGSLAVVDDEDVRQEIRSALETTRSLPDTPLDHLCCGNMGRVEILLFAHQKLGDRDLLGQARTLTDRVLHRAEAEEHFGLVPPEEEHRFDPSLFRGVSGIGFTLARLAGPERPPCLLLMA